MDQGFFAGASFLINIMLARWLSLGEYGFFAVIYAIFILLARIHSAILIEPMSIFGRGKYAENLSEYLGLVIYWHCGIFGGLALLLLLIAGLLWWAGLSVFANGALCIAVITPFVLLMWLVRQAFYVKRQIHLAATGGALYLVLSLLGIHGLYTSGFLSPTTAIIVMGLAGLLVSVWSIILLRPLLFSGKKLTPGLVINDCWGYGKWAVGGGLLIWFTNNIYFIVLPWTAGFEEGGAFRALLNLLLPFQHMVLAISGILLPLMAGKFWKTGIKDVHKLLKISTLIVIPLGLLYSLLVIVYSKPLIRVLYAGKYDDYAGDIWLGALLPVLWGVLILSVTSLRAMNLPRRVFWGLVFFSITVTVVAIPLTMRFNIAGAFIGWSISLAVATCSMTWHYQKSRLADVKPGENSVLNVAGERAK